MTAHVRAAGAADVPALLALVEQYWAFEHLPGFDARRLAPALKRLCADARLGGAWLALDADGAPAGYLLGVYVFSLEHFGLTAEIDELFVLPARRGAGVAAALLAAAEDAFARAGCTNVSLQLGRANDAARAFYRRHGYAPRAGYDLVEKTLDPK